ncbi:succinate dehydrogenase/fumarate reductase cytochrome b subunit [Shewanella sp. Choline-02u-19]|jgi:fumarate reductase subunit C|uniref:fumarate reductase cytochrome b subunit n=1 Tax=Shewanella TaxID=22 RepID=UPI000C3387B4|nr:MULTISPECIES: fumarate reductase cytochrome b subunit [Shewanella]MCL1057078.1 fumarate reductase cytochrome b subunit [Shewanella gelidimarina]PKG55804.1 succinate dehydrogenase/fumarate reductase cytochrome b subunit [Shewanella sp. GutDb-MelDb]PKG74992.1 succinate dehydrogenase/fumarate reductase cytochrome b subunit [Shewanella sp. GutCb]PKH58787.1 succinate dehydrogenase/fumarate reductase cytochrome b subunit [Shewanella sp. Bg11-22]PKI29067.1 succinate dehydrogenase/fumarate reductas
MLASYVSATGHPASAKADKIQSITGVLMGCFLLAHLHFESSILLGKEAFYTVVQFLEGGMFSSTGHGFPIVTKVFSVFMLLVVMAHAAVALRRFPAQIGQWRALRRHMSVINHKDSHAWFWQLITGFVLFFLVPVHLFTMIANPEIGPHLSADRVYNQNAWLLYALLLPAVVIHAMIGLYRVAVKWGLTTKRTGLRKLAKGLIIYLIVIGLMSLISYLIIGSDLSLPVEAYRPS